MKVFVAGIMQGSRLDHEVQTQDYRQRIAQAVMTRHPDAQVIDPWALFPDAVGYSPEQAKQTLMKEMELASECDVLIAYLPEASMGTTLEIWSAYQAGVHIVCISKMTRNWVIQSFAAEIHPTLDDFLNFVETGGLGDALDGSKPAR